MTTNGTKRIDYYAGKASARKTACGALDEALANLAASEQRARAAAERLEKVQQGAQAELDATLAELERQHQEAMRVARATAHDRIHAAKSEHGNATALATKAREAAEQARSRLLRLVPSSEELRGPSVGQSEERTPTPGGTIIHVSTEKSWLLREIAEHGLRSVLVVPDGVSDEEMIARIERDPRAYFVMDPDCDRRTEAGTCAGHPLAPPCPAGHAADTLCDECPREPASAQEASSAA